jgi:hypothetical protein
MHLIETLGSLSIVLAMILVGLLSAILALVTSFIKPVAIRWAFLGGVPLILAYTLYWSPVWLGGSKSDENSAWQLIFLVPGATGILASSVVSDFIQGRFKAKSGRPPNP